MHFSATSMYVKINIICYSLYIYIDMNSLTCNKRCIKCRERHNNETHEMLLI